MGKRQCIVGHGELRLFFLHFWSATGLDGRENHFASPSLHLFLKIRVTVFHFLPYEVVDNRSWVLNRLLKKKKDFKKKDDLKTVVLYSNPYPC